MHQHLFVMQGRGLISCFQGWVYIRTQLEACSRGEVSGTFLPHQTLGLHHQHQLRHLHSPKEPLTECHWGKEGF